MRFVPEGPDIPNDLIREWRRGELLFLAGAGVSVPSRLPLFEGLALGVYKLLGDPLFDVLTKASQASGREKVLNDANLSPDKRVEANLFFDRQYDRLFSALEKRIDPDLRGRTKTRKVRRAVEDILSGNTYSPSHYDLLQLSQAPNSSGDRSRRLSCRIRILICCLKAHGKRYSARSL